MDMTVSALEARVAESVTPCDAATRQWEDAHQWSQRLMFLVYVVAAAVAAAVVVLIVMALLQKPAGAIAGAIATVVTGAAMGFVRAERNRAGEMEANALKVMNKICKTTT